MRQEATGSDRTAAVRGPSGPPFDAECGTTMIGQ